LGNHKNEIKTHSADEYIGGIGDIEDLFILLTNAAMSFTNNKRKMFHGFPRDQDTCIDAEVLYHLAVLHQHLL
jgi:hypothetical protein